MAVHLKVKKVLGAVVVVAVRVLVFIHVREKTLRNHEVGSFLYLPSLGKLPEVHVARTVGIQLSPYFEELLSILVVHVVFL